MHWTYQQFDAASDLEQGDFLVPTLQLRQALGQAHGHFCDEKYLGFLVVTQTCDLVRRGAAGSPKVQYVTIAAVRAMNSVVTRLLATSCDPWGCGIFPASRKEEGRRLLTRIFNQNEQALGVFFLHPDLDLEIGEDALALLRVTVALRAGHYEAIAAARRGRLATAFQAKLGWLVANLYGRAATPDWSDQAGGPRELRKLIAKYIDDDSGSVWIDDGVMKQAKSAGLLGTMTPAELREHLSKQRVLERAAQIADEAVEVLRKMSSGPEARFALDEQQLQSFRNRLLNSKIRTFLQKQEI